MSRRGLWACGTLGKVHGLRGELYLNLAVDGLDHLERGEEFFLWRPAPADGAESLTPCAVRRAGGTDQRPLVVIDLAASREEAYGLQGCELLAAGGELDDEPHYVVGDLLGLRAETVSGHLLGTVDDVIETPVHEVLQIKTDAGGDLLVPLVEELVEVDADAGVVRVVDGLLEEPEDGG